MKEHAFRIQKGMSEQKDEIASSAASSNRSPAIDPMFLIIALAAPRGRGLRYSSGMKARAAFSTPSIDSTENQRLETPLTSRETFRSSRAAAWYAARTLRQNSMKPARHCGAPPLLGVM